MPIDRHLCNQHLSSSCAPFCGCIGGSELKSAEGTTQGDPLAMSMYAISLQPLISLLHNRSTAKQCWFADDATGAGPLEEVKQWWDELREAGLPLGYYPNSKKCWLVVKPEKEGS